MLWLLRKYVYLVPQILLFVAFVASWFDFEKGDITLYRLGHTAGFSLLVWLVFAVYFFRRAFCVATRLSTAGLGLISLYNLAGSFLPYETYDAWFDRLVFALVWVSTVTILFKNRKQKQ